MHDPNDRNSRNGRNVKKQIIQIMISSPVPDGPSANEVAQKKCKRSPEEIVRDAIEMVQSGYESAEEWEILKRLNNSLMAREKLNRRQMQILCMIEPIINRYRQFDSGDVTQDPVKMSRIRAELERGNVGNNQSERERGSKK